MSQEVKNIRIQQKVDTRENWEKSSLQLLENEIAYEKETGKYKIGTGNKTWSELEYAAGGEVLDIPVKASEGENSAIFSKSTNDFNEADLPELGEIYYKPINPGYFYEKEILTDKVIDGSNFKQLSFSGTELDGYGVVQGSEFRPSETVKEGDICLFNGTYYYSDNSDEYKNFDFKGYVIITDLQDPDEGYDGALWFKPISITDFHPFPTIHDGWFEPWALTVVDVRYRFENLAFTKNVIGTTPLPTTLYTYTDKWSNKRYTIYEDYTPDGKLGENGEGTSIVTNNDPIYNTIKCEVLFNQKKYAIATGNNTISVGQDSVAFGNNAIAMGKTSMARGSNSGAFGINGLATGINSVALNEGGKAVGYASLAVNDHCEAVNYNTIAGGYKSVASGHTSFAFGNAVKATGRCSAVFGQTNEARGNYNFVTGRWNRGIGTDVAVFGMNNIANGQLSLVSGLDNKENGAYCFVSGNNNYVSGRANFVAGSLNTITGAGSAVFGSQNNVSGDNGCAAFGILHDVNGKKNLVTGQDNTTATNTENNLVVGLNNTVDGNTRNSIISGWKNYVTDTQKVAMFGEGLIAKRDCQTVMGLYNEPDRDALLVIGNGSDKDNKNNALTLNADGTLTTQGAVNCSNIFLTDTNSMICMKSPNGTEYVLRVEDDGTLSTMKWN